MFANEKYSDATENTEEMPMQTGIITIVRCKGFFRAQIMSNAVASALIPSQRALHRKTCHVFGIVICS
jgi:non-canonical (house-cleaning) NTP pyrophosphatase